jgi:hypothetical protein
MKKTILSFLLIGSAGLAIAQQQPATSNPDRSKINNNGNTNTNLNNTQPTNPNPNYPQTTNVNTNTDSTVMGDPSYPATNSNVQNNAAMNSTVKTTYELNVPASIKASFTTSYPEVTTSSWYQSGDWYVARYVDNGQIKQVSYREDGKVLNAMMSPVRKSFVPEEIVNQAIQKYGANLYAIGSSRGTDGQEMYNVTLIENGQSSTEWMNTDGSTADNHFRTAEETTMSVDQSSMNVQEQTEVTIQDSTVNEPVATDSTSLKDERTEPQPEHSHPQDENQDEGSNNANQEGLNNASEINASPRRL